MDDDKKSEKPKKKKKDKVSKTEQTTSIEVTKHHGWPDVDFKKTLGCG